MSRDTAQDFVHTNAEYEKLKGARGDDGTPRETPAGQGPGRRGYDKQFYAEWTREELLEQARRLGVEVDEGIERERLVELLEARDATSARAAPS